MKTAIICGAVAPILLLYLIATTRILRSAAHSRAQQIAWLLLVWLVPVIGAVLALQVASEPDHRAPSAKSPESGPEVWIGGG